MDTWLLFVIILEHLIDNFPEFLNPDDMFLTMYKKTSTDTADDHHDFLHDVYKNITKETKELHVVIFSGTETMMNLMQAVMSYFWKWNICIYNFFDDPKKQEESEVCEQILTIIGKYQISFMSLRNRKNLKAC